jgi:hypothetical protein
MTIVTDGSQTDVNAALVAASPGDIITMPAGTFTWGASGLGTVVDKAITLQGAGQGTTTINAHTDADGVLFVSAGIIKSFTINQSNGDRLIYCGGGDGWRFTDMDINGAASGRTIDIEACFGLFDNCNIHLDSEQIFMYGKTTAWDGPPDFGSANAVYFEDCAFTGDGYTDSNADGQMVFRFCTIAGQMKFDAHGVWSNTPARSSRFIEVYYNTWTLVGEGAFWPSAHLRGGAAMIHHNTVDDGTFGGRGILWLDEYGALATGGYWGSVYQTPFQQPILGLIGIGSDETTLGEDPAYLFGNRKDGDLAEIIGSDIPAAAITQYRADTSNPSATFTMIGTDPAEAVIVHDRDYFAEGGTDGTDPAPFNGTTGVGIGTAAQMAAITPTTDKVGFWVTDEGSWNTLLPANTSGRLYVWDGDSWNLHYEPYTYPHPLRDDSVTPSQPGIPSTSAMAGMM